MIGPCQPCHWWQKVNVRRLTAMTQLLNTFGTLTLLIAVVAVLVTTGSTVRHDRPSMPLGGFLDWRDDPSFWSRLRPH